MSNFVEESVSQVKEMNTGVEADPVLNGVRNRDRNFSTNPRPYKHGQSSRNDMMNLYQYGSGYQNQQYNSNWGDSVQFEQTRLSNYSNNFPTNSNNYPANNTTYPSNNTSYPSSTSTYPANTMSYPGTNSSYPNNTTTYASNASSSYVPGYGSSMPLVGDARMPPPLPMSNSQMLGQDSSSLEEIAYLFTFRYYSLFNTNPTLMYSLYAKDAHMSKTDPTGKRVVATDHNEIRNYYQQFTSHVLTSNIQNIEIQVGNPQYLLLVLITGSFTLTNEKENFEQTRQFAQSVLLSGDMSRNRFQIVNDLLVELNVNNFNASTNNVLSSQTEQPQEVLPTSELASRTLKKETNKDGLKLAIFGIPNMVTEVILTDLINQRLGQLGSEGKVVDVAIKPQKVNRKSNESLLYAFVELDSQHAVETLLANELQIHDRNITLEPYKRTEKKREFKPKTQNY